MKFEILVDVLIYTENANCMTPKRDFFLQIEVVVTFWDFPPDCTKLFPHHGGSGVPVPTPWDHNVFGVSALCCFA